MAARSPLRAGFGVDQGIVEQMEATSPMPPAKLTLDMQIVGSDIGSGFGVHCLNAMQLEKSNVFFLAQSPPPLTVRSGSSHCRADGGHQSCAPCEAHA
jgi:hypothetical protein